MDEMPNGRHEPLLSDESGLLTLRASCPACGNPLHDAPYTWGLAQVRLLERRADARTDELVTRCAKRDCRAWAACTYSRKVA